MTTPEQAMDKLKQQLDYITMSNTGNDSRIRAAMIRAMLDGVDRITLRDMAMAVGRNVSTNVEG